MKVKGKRVKRPSNWREYTSSSNKLNDDISQYGKEHFDFVIVSLHRDKSELAFAEAAIQWKCDVGYAKFPDGTRKYYNGRVEPLRYSANTRFSVFFAESP